MARPRKKDSQASVSGSQQGDLSFTPETNEFTKEDKKGSVPMEKGSAVLVQVERKGKEVITLDTEHFSYGRRLLDQLEHTHLRENDDDLEAVMRKWKPNDKGIINTLKKEDIPRVVTVEGMPTIRRALTHVIETYAHDRVKLPFGHLGRLKSAGLNKLQSYLSMIAMRFNDIPEIDYRDIMLLSSVNTTTAGNGESTNVGDFLSQLTRSARDRYMMNNVIMPLLRDVLIKDTGIKMFTGVPVLKSANLYSVWRESTDKPILRGPLQSDVTTTLGSAEYEWLNSYVGLANTLITGIDQSAFIGLPLLLSAVEDPAVIKDKTHALTTPKADGSITSINPVYSLHRKSVLNNLNGRPIWIADQFGISAPKDITVHEVAWTIVQLAKLKNVSIINDVDLMFMSRYPEWSGLLVDSNVGELVSEEWKDFVDEILMMEFLRQATLTPSVDQVVASMFDEPNRADLHASLNSKLYFISLTNKVAVNVLTDLLTAMKSSVEFGFSDFWDSLNELIPEATLSTLPSMNGHTHVRTYDIKNPVFTANDRRINSSYYFLEEGLNYKHPVMDHFRVIVEEMGVLGSMKTEPLSIRKFITSEDTSFDISSLSKCSDYVNLVDVNLTVLNKDEIDSEHPLYKYVDKLKSVKRFANSQEGNVVVIGRTACAVITRYDLDAYDNVLYQTSEIKLDSYDLSRVFNIFTMDDKIRILQPQNLIEIVPGSSFSYDPVVLAVLPEDNAKFKELITKWEHNTIVSPETESGGSDPEGTEVV